ncbi:unnamed protein product, partial [Amoebophrya sp. A120]|eukprot:GSA120T00015352001.1
MPLIEACPASLCLSRKALRQFRDPLSLYSTFGRSAWYSSECRMRILYPLSRFEIHMHEEDRVFLNKK